MRSSALHAWAQAVLLSLRHERNPTGWAKGEGQRTQGPAAVADACRRETAAAAAAAASASPGKLAAWSGGCGFGGRPALRLAIICRRHSTYY